MQVIKPQIIIKKLKIGPDTNPHKAKNTQTSNTIFFDELVPSVLPLLKKHIRLGLAGIIVSMNIPFIRYILIGKPNSHSA